MPRYDKTGPNGEGSMTGRKNGLCTGNKVETDDMRYGRGRGRGMFGFRGGEFGFRFRAGRGDSAFSNESNPNAQQVLKEEIKDMKKQLSVMEDNLARIKKK